LGWTDEGTFQSAGCGIAEFLDFVDVTPACNFAHQLHTRHRAPAAAASVVIFNSRCQSRGIMPARSCVARSRQFRTAAHAKKVATINTESKAFAACRDDAASS
jgi:hypothetical protein